MVTSHLRAHPLWNRYPEWTPSLHHCRTCPLTTLTLIASHVYSIINQHFKFFFLSIQSGHFHGNLWAKGDHQIEVSYLKAHPLEGRYPEWTPNFHSDRSQYSNLCARGSQGPQSTGGSTVPRRQSIVLYFD